MIKQKHTYIECECDIPTHNIRLTADIENREILIETRLRTLSSFFKRLAIAIEYLFGYQSSYEGCLLTPSTIFQLVQFLVKFQRDAGLLDINGSKKIEKALKVMNNSNELPHLEDIKKKKIKK